MCTYSSPIFDNIDSFNKVSRTLELSKAWSPNNTDKNANVSEHFNEQHFKKIYDQSDPNSDKSLNMSNYTGTEQDNFNVKGSGILESNKNAEEQPANKSKITRYVVEHHSSGSDSKEKNTEAIKDEDLKQKDNLRALSTVKSSKIIKNNETLSKSPGSRSTDVEYDILEGASIPPKISVSEKVESKSVSKSKPDVKADTIDKTESTIKPQTTTNRPDVTKGAFPITVNAESTSMPHSKTESKDQAINKNPNANKTESTSMLITRSESRVDSPDDKAELTSMSKSQQVYKDEDHSVLTSRNMSTQSSTNMEQLTLESQDRAHDKFPTTVKTENTSALKIRSEMADKSQSIAPTTEKIKPVNMSNIKTKVDVQGTYSSTVKVESTNVPIIPLNDKNTQDLYSSAGTSTIINQLPLTKTASQYKLTDNIENKGFSEKKIYVEIVDTRPNKNSKFNEKIDNNDAVHIKVSNVQEDHENLVQVKLSSEFDQHPIKGERRVLSNSNTSIANKPEGLDNQIFLQKPSLSGKKNETDKTRVFLGPSTFSSGYTPASDLISDFTKSLIRDDDVFYNSSNISKETLNIREENLTKIGKHVFHNDLFQVQSLISTMKSEVNIKRYGNDVTTSKAIINNDSNNANVTGTIKEGKQLLKNSQLQGQNLSSSLNSVSKIERPENKSTANNDQEQTDSDSDNIIVNKIQDLIRESKNGLKYNQLQSKKPSTHMEPEFTIKNPENDVVNNTFQTYTG